MTCAQKLLAWGLLGGASRPGSGVGLQPARAVSGRVWTAARGQPGMRHPAGEALVCVRGTSPTVYAGTDSRRECATWTQEERNEPEQVTQKGRDRSYTIHDR